MANVPLFSRSSAEILIWTDIGYFHSAFCSGPLLGYELRWPHAGHLLFRSHILFHIPKARWYQSVYYFLPSPNLTDVIY